MRKIFLNVTILLLISLLAAFADAITVAGAANVQFTLDDLKAEFTGVRANGLKWILKAMSLLLKG